MVPCGPEPEPASGEVGVPMLGGGRWPPRPERPAARGGEERAGYLGEQEAHPQGEHGIVNQT